MSAPISWWVWVEAARLRTLPAAIIPVLVGTALAVSQGAANYTAAALCLSFALLVQIGTNYANDYYDFIHGADTAQRVGPRRAVAAGLVSPAAMRRAMALIMIVAFLVGLGLIRFGGWCGRSLGDIIVRQWVALAEEHADRRHDFIRRYLRSFCAVHELSWIIASDRGATPSLGPAKWLGLAARVAKFGVI